MIKYLAYEKSPVIDMKYYAKVEKQLVEVVCQAFKSRVEAGIGAEAIKALLAMPKGNMVPLAAKSGMLALNRRKPDPQRVKKCLELVVQDPEKTGITEWVFAKEIVLLDAMIRKEPLVRAEVQAIQVGAAIFITNPAEFFCQLGLDIKAGTMIVDESLRLVKQLIPGKMPEFPKAPPFTGEPWDLGNVRPELD